MATLVLMSCLTACGATNAPSRGSSSSGNPAGLGHPVIRASTSGVRNEAGRRGCRRGSPPSAPSKRAASYEAHRAVLGRYVAGLERRGPARAWAEAITMTSSLPNAWSAGQAYREGRNGLVRRIERKRVPAVLGKLGDGRDVLEAVFGTIASRRPKRSSAASTAARLPSRVVRSAANALARSVRVGLEVDGEDLHPVVDQLLGDRASDAAAGAGDERGACLWAGSCQVSPISGTTARVADWSVSQEGSCMSIASCPPAAETFGPDLGGHVLPSALNAWTAGLRGLGGLLGARVESSGRAHGPSLATCCAGSTR